MSKFYIFDIEPIFQHCQAYIRKVLKKNKSIHQKVQLSIKALGAQIVFYKALRGNGLRGGGGGRNFGAKNTFSFRVLILGTV